MLNNVQKHTEQVLILVCTNSPILSWIKVHLVDGCVVAYETVRLHILSTSPAHHGTYHSGS